ncbi:Protein BONZAI 3 [Ranunculus cassubicifolius]
MGGCLSSSSDVKEGVGGRTDHHQQQQHNPTAATNEAVDLFYRSHDGLQPLFTALQLSLSATKLRDRDIISKSDPMAVGYIKRRDGKLEEIGHTEVIMNTLDPVWIGKFSIAYQFEIVQPLVFHVYDVDTKYHNLPVTSLKLKEQEFLGEASCALSEIVTKQSKSLTLKLERKHGHDAIIDLGSLTVHAEETISSRQAFEIIFRSTELENKDRFSKSDPFIRISKTAEGGNMIPICKTEVVMDDLNPTWKPVCLTMQQIGSKENPLVIECFDFDNSGKHGFIGKLQKSMSDLEILYHEKVGANFLKPSSSRPDHMKTVKGQIFVDSFCEKMLYSFLDYISSGFELNFMVAVDFTASNGNPRLNNSLHYIDLSGRLNSYQEAILEVGEVIQFYDSDKHFPAWGFGGRTSDGNVSHCFNLNGSPSESEVNGVNGIMSAYSTALRNVSLAGPTLFGEVINRAARLASQSVAYKQRKYSVLLIITDGVVTDLQETKNAIVKASDLPLSILIIGVGGADFKEMEVLDADNGKRLESSTGRVATRDIVQFVPMREVHGGQISIIQALLQELPSQFLTYVRSKNILPSFVHESHTSDGHH